MKKAVTVFVVLTPIAFLIWALAFCLSGIINGDIAEFVPYLTKMFGNVQILWQKEYFTTLKIITDSFIGALLIGLVLYFVLSPVRKRFGYMWHTILAVVATVPPVITLVNYPDHFKAMLADEALGTKVLGYFVVGAALLTTALMFVLFLLTFIDLCMHPGKKVKAKISNVDEFGVDVKVAPAVTIGENGLSSKAIPASEPVPEKKQITMVDEIRNVVQEELAKMHSRLQVRQDVVNSLNNYASNMISESDVPSPVVVGGKKGDGNNPVKIVIMTDQSKKEDIIPSKPQVVPMVETPASEDEDVEMLVEPLVEVEPEIIEEPLVEPDAVEEPPVEEPDEVKVEEPIQEPVPMEEPPYEEEEEKQLEVVEETNIPEPEEEIIEDPLPEEEIEEVVEEEPAPEFEEEPEDEDKEEVIEEPEMEVTPEEDIIGEVTPEEEIKEEEPLTFEKEPEGLVSAPAFEEEPEPEQEGKIEEIVAPVVEEVKPTYERISFMDRMINADPEMKAHYNELKNLILSYGVKSRVSNSGDAFRLHTKTYVKITIAGKSLKLYFALDPKDYENTTLPIQDASNKGIYAEIPLVFKVKSDLSMKRAKDLISDAMAKDSLEQGEVTDIDYVEALKDEVATQDSED